MHRQPDGSTVRLRLARLDDVAVLMHWDTLPHVIAATGDDDHIDWASEIASMETDVQETLIAELGGTPIGVVQIIDPAREPTHYWGEVEPNQRAIDIWIGPADQLGQGFGTQMMTEALDRCFADPAVTAVLIDPLTTNIDAHRFYQRLGFTVVGTRMFGTDDCLVHVIDRDTWTARRF